MFERSERVRRIAGSERSQRKLTPPKGTIRLDLGEPDFPTPLHIQEAATKAMRDNYTHYANAFGDSQLREAVCAGLKRDYGVERSVDEILVTAGGAEAIHVITATYLNDGDEVLILDPEYSGYADSVALFGGRPVYAPLREDFHLDLQAVEQRITPRTKMIFISSPGNPTSRVLREDEVRALARIARDHDLLIIVDEVYYKLMYGGGKHFSICQVEEIQDRAILLNSFSKTYAMTGWRVGYIVAAAKVIKDLVTFHKAMVTCPNNPAQRACIAALTGPQECVDQMLREYDKRRALVAGKLKGIANISTPACEGAFYFFPRFNHSLSSQEMTAYLFEKGIMVRSGTEFGGNGQKHIRLSFATSIENLEAGLDRLKTALDELK